jgi:hypothetical protein
VCKEGGDLKLACLGTRIHDLMRITRLNTVFEIFDNDTPAIITSLLESSRTVGNYPNFAS